MQYVRHKKLISTLRGLVIFALILEILMAAMVLIIFATTIISSEDTLLSAWPVEVGAAVTDLRTSSIHPHLSDVAVTINQGSIQFSSESVDYYLLKFLEIALGFAITIGVTWLLIRILSSLQHQRIFTTENAHRLRNIALLVILATPYSLIKSLTYRGYIATTIEVEGKEYANLFDTFSANLSSNQIWLSFDTNWQALLTGLILLIIAEVFRVGVLIKLDNESIV
ncbi:DUF2975 domain-containing protein [Tunicatimonas pelagia]|uniref:DUF2975 domain-containing protein n=1 Tax=Tunicatimonas pelagia TaxID=931531 RepID=UPI002665F117|nr:DUF2975 domain-containing protein [Tunicatimonas pelagia]WKN42578.1 DUF2975 domain-containing protein [Tunicatimonas pelagia]